jgi:hypothetical protein
MPSRNWLRAGRRAERPGRRAHAEYDGNPAHAFQAMLDPASADLAR